MGLLMIERPVQALQIMKKRITKLIKPRWNYAKE
jgi:hypothetical protein